MNLKKPFHTPTTRPLRILHTDQDVKKIVSEQVVSWFPKFPREYVVVCIGTDRSTGDALGPLVGTIFSDNKPKHMTVYGTLHEPVHATNIEDYIEIIYDTHRNPFIIAIDACLGKSSSVGHIIANKGPLKPGAAFNKPLPEIGDIYLTGVVNVSGMMEYAVLQNTRLSFVKDMAGQIASVLNVIDGQLTYHRHSPAIVVPSIIQQNSI